MGKFWETHEQGSFPSLNHLSVDRLSITIGKTFPAQGGDPDSFLAACDRVVTLLRDRPTSASIVRFEGLGAAGADPPHPVDAFGSGVAAPSLRRLLAGLCGVLDVVREHVLPRARVLSPPGSLAPLHPSKVELEIDSSYLIWDDPSVWHAITRLTQTTTGLSIDDDDEPRFVDSIRFSAPGPVVPPRLILGSGASAVPAQRAYESAPGAYKHYLHNVSQLIEEAPSLCSISVTSKGDFNDDYNVDARWTASAAEGLATLLLSLRSAGPALKEVTLSGSFGRRLAFPAPEGGSWMEPGVDSFAQAYMALVKANRALEEIEIANLAEWCKPSEHGRPSFPADAAATFSESSVAHLSMQNVTLHPSDDLFFASIGAHSRKLTRLHISGCAFGDSHAKALAGGLSEGRGAPLKELHIDDWDQHMTDDGILCFADMIPQCGLEELCVELDQGDEGPSEECYDNAITTKGLAALFRALEMNTTLRVLEVSPIKNIPRLEDDVYEGWGEAVTINRRVNPVLLRSIKKELANNADPEKRVHTFSSSKYNISDLGRMQCILYQEFERVTFSIKTMHQSNCNVESQAG